MPPAKEGDAKDDDAERGPGPRQGVRHRDRGHALLDLPGLMQHFSIPMHELSEENFEDGLGFDGSSIRGFQEIQESDMLLVPAPIAPTSTRSRSTRR